MVSNQRLHVIAAKAAASDREQGPARSCAAAISFTFDDGRLSTHTHAFPLLQKAGMVDISPSSQTWSANPAVTVGSVPQCTRTA